MNVYERTLRELFGKSDILSDAKYTGKTCLARLDKDLRVKLQFATTGTAGNYAAICASIINRTDGLVDKQTFAFKDMVPARSASQAYGRQYPYIWEYNGNPEWYGQPLSTKEKQLVRETILEYVQMYMEQEMTMTVQSM